MTWMDVQRVDNYDRRSRWRWHYCLLAVGINAILIEF